MGRPNYGPTGFSLASGKPISKSGRVFEYSVPMTLLSLSICGRVDVSVLHTLHEFNVVKVSGCHTSVW